MFELPPLAGWPAQPSLIRDPEGTELRKGKRKGLKRKRQMKKHGRK